MRVLYDYSAFVMQARGGVSRVLYELFRHVAEMPDVECKLFAGFHRNQYLRDAPVSVKRHIVGWYLPEKIVKQRIFMPINCWLFKLYARKFKPEVCHYTYFDTPQLPVGCKVVITMHDMIHELYPQMFTPKDPHHGWKQQAVAHADGIICVSETTKKDLARFFDISGKKVEVIHHGNSLASVSPKKVAFSYPYFLYVGTRAVEYKNFELVLSAFARCQDTLNAHLVCFGGGAFSDAELQKMNEMGLTERVHQTGGSDEELAGYYAGAEALIYPSKYEGFGLPPIEAMGLGCPVISSNAPPMPEIVRDAGLYFDPMRAESLYDCMRSIHEEKVRQGWITKGFEHSRLFSWDVESSKTLMLYKKLASHVQ